MIIRQEKDNPYGDTTVFVESLIYSDGTKNDTADHKWHVHVEQPGSDYYNWTGRCLSAGGHFNPYRSCHQLNLISVFCMKSFICFEGKSMTKSILPSNSLAIKGFLI